MILEYNGEHFIFDGSFVEFCPRQENLQGDYNFMILWFASDGSHLHSGWYSEKRAVGILDRLVKDGYEVTELGYNERTPEMRYVRKDC